MVRRTKAEPIVLNYHLVWTTGKEYQMGPHGLMGCRVPPAYPPHPGLLEKSLIRI